MSRMDDELEQALRDAEASGHGSGASDEVMPPTSIPPFRRTQARPSPGGSRKNVGLLIGLIAMAGGILALVFTSIEGNGIYSRTVDELVKESRDPSAAPRLRERQIRVQGTLEKGSLARRAEPCEYRFTLKQNGETLNVRYPQCVIPDTFRDEPYMDVMVTAEGRLTESGDFQASSIMAKCPSKYDTKDRPQGRGVVPHAEVEPVGAAPAVN